MPLILVGVPSCDVVKTQLLYIKAKQMGIHPPFFMIGIHLGSFYPIVRRTALGNMGRDLP